MQHRLVVLLVILSQVLYGQELGDLKSRFRYEMKATVDEIVVDGHLDEATWQQAEIGTDFWQKVPFFKEGADPKTEIMLSHDDKNLYVGAICYQTEPIVSTSLKRDQYWDNDGIAVILDPLNTKSYSVLFGTSAVGVQWDAERSQTSDINSDWSNKWYVETQITDTYWSAEFAIPLRILRYDPSFKEWGLNFVRNIQYCNEFHNWTAVPEGFWPPDANFAGALAWDEAPQKQKGNYNLIPYVVSGVRKLKGQDTELDLDAGLDAKVSLSSTLNLDLTFNPDFSQVEVDELVTNLTRFSIFLPEKRNFFLENADIFGGFGNSSTRPFFSRRIGLNAAAQPVPILYGARLTGNLTPTTRIGVLNVHSRTTENSLGQNQSAFAVNKQFGRSFIQGMFLNRQAFDGGEYLSSDFGRNLSLEGLYASDNGRFNLWAGAHQSFKPEIDDKTGFYNVGLEFTNQNWQILSDFNFVQPNYFADLGFVIRRDNFDAARDTVIRTGYLSSYTSVDYIIRPREGRIAQHRFGVENLLVYNPDGSFNERYNRIRYFLSFRNTSEIRIRYNLNELDLLYPFTFTGADPPPTAKYKTMDVQLEYESDERKPLSYSVSAQRGGFYNGTITQLRADVNYRVQPWGNFSIGYQWNDLTFPEAFGSTLITALVSKVEIGFSRNLLWTTLFQFVDQSDFVGINSRLQWRFSPMSDLFLVYVDNYDLLRSVGGSNSLGSNNRALLLKANYWY